MIRAPLVFTRSLLSLSTPAALCCGCWFAFATGGGGGCDLQFLLFGTTRADRREKKVAALRLLAHALELFFGLTFEINYQPSGSDPD